VAGYPIRARHWTRKEYDRLIELGVLHEDERIELIGGQMIVAEPKGTPHSTSVALTADVLRVAFGVGWLVRQQDPVALDDDSEPEPDIVVVPGTPRDYLGEHPRRPALVVEVSESSLRFDRSYKGSVYARAAVADYWIVNLLDRVLEIRRRPIAAPSARFGWRYAELKIVRAGGVAAPLAKPDAAIAVADLLP
jgi:Uma2 family endonuclease